MVTEPRAHLNCYHFFDIEVTGIKNLLAHSVCMYVCMYKTDNDDTTELNSIYIGMKEKRDPRF